MITAKYDGNIEKTIEILVNFGPENKLFNDRTKKNVVKID